MSKKKLSSFYDLINTYFQSFINTYIQSCHNMNIFWSASFVKFPWHCWTEFSQSWKDLRKTLRSHENLRSLTDLSDGNIGIHSNVHDVKNQGKTCKQYFLSSLKIAEIRFQSTNISLLLCIEYIYLYQNCTDSVVLV